MHARQKNKSTTVTPQHTDLCTHFRTYRHICTLVHIFLCTHVICTHQQKQIGCTHWTVTFTQSRERMLLIQYGRSLTKNLAEGQTIRLQRTRLSTSGQTFQLFLHFSHLADALIQSDLQEQLWSSNLLKGTSRDFSTILLGDLNQQPFGYWPNALNH